MAKNKKFKEDIDYKYNLGIYFSLLKKYKIYFITVLIIITIVEGFTVLEKFLFKELVDRGTEFAAGTITTPTFVNILTILAIIFGSMVLGRVIFDWLKLHMVNHLETNLIRDLKRKFFNHILTLSHEFHTTHKTGSLISRLIRGGGAVERLTDVFVFNFAPLIFQLVILGVSLIYLDITSALIILIITISFISYSYYINYIQRESLVTATYVEDREKANLADFYTNMESIKYFGKENSIMKRYKTLAQRTRDSLLKAWNYYRWMAAGQIAILAIGTFMLILFPVLSFLKGETTIGTIVFIYTAYGSLLGPLFGFVHGIRATYRSMADFEALFQYYKIENEVKDAPDAEKLKVKEGTIEFKNVTFAYKKRKILRNFNLKIPKNKRIALVGPSGSGKSTIVKLLYRLYDLQRGSILIDNKDIKKVTKESLRSELSIVPQECVLFDDTIYNNIKFSNPRKNRKEVEKAIKFAQLHKIIKNFPYQEKTIVGERGVRLSGGEKQRVSIARALLADKKILVLDEATSSLDSETEHEIQKDLENLMEGRTSIIIAHRLSTIMKADIIVVLDKGKIVQKGTHHELIKQPGMYQKLWELQKGGYIK